MAAVRKTESIAQQLARLEEEAADRDEPFGGSGILLSARDRAVIAERRARFWARFPAEPGPADEPEALDA